MRYPALCLTTIGLMLPVLALGADPAQPGGAMRRPPALRMPAGTLINFGSITLPSGHVYTLLHLGALQLEGEKDRFLGLMYLSETADPAILRDAAQELFEAMQWVPERAGADAYVVFAYLLLAKDQVTKLDDIMPYEVRFKRAARGPWSREIPEGQVPNNPKACGTCRPPTSDKEGVAAARKAGLLWLGHLMLGSSDEAARAIAAPARSHLTPEKLVDLSRQLRDGLGRIVERSELSVVELRQVPAMPPGKYVELTWRTNSAKVGDLIERLTMSHDDDQWRVVGYSIR